LNGQELVTIVLDQGGFDVSRAVVLGWINEKYDVMVGHSKWRKARVDFGTTTNGDGRYAVPDGVVSIETGLRVDYADGSLIHDQVSVTELWGIENGTLQVQGGAYTDHYDDQGKWSVDLWPVPEEDGAGIFAVGAILPVPLADSPSSVPITPPKTWPALVEGSIALGKARLDERYDAADRDEARFTAVVDQMAGDLLARDNSGAQQIRVAGYHF
jgi:hypothetical protein